MQLAAAAAAAAVAGMVYSNDSNYQFTMVAEIWRKSYHGGGVSMVAEMQCSVQKADELS